MSIKVNQDILRLEIPVKNALRMDVLQTKQDFGKVKPGLVLSEILAALKQVKQLAARTKVKNEVQVFLRRKSALHRNEKRVFA